MNRLGDRSIGTVIRSSARSRVREAIMTLAEKAFAVLERKQRFLLDFALYIYINTS
jgi:hypothetical protein